MRHIIFSLSFLLLVSNTGNGQDSLIYTYEQNRVWFEDVSTESLSMQKQAICSRLLVDTTLVRRTPGYCRTVISESMTTEQLYDLSKRFARSTDGKPTVVINRRRINTDDTTSARNIEMLCHLISQISVRKIEFLTPGTPETLALYGRAGLDGIIYLTLARKKDLKKFEGLFHTIY